MAEHMVARSIEVDAPVKRIFDLLADPVRHSELDGSGTVLGSVFGPQRLELGSEFGMDMRMLGLPYRMTNRVVEFEEGRLIAWKHVGSHRWRYVLEDLGSGRTRVTETFDYTWGQAYLYVLSGAPARNARGIEETLVRLKAVAEQD
ncbi:SRPBCC family protein [Nocardiopsis sp. MG754419]|uniref:SRPBCC family protein n=1 Tax=Nocardiopsis sp. MG754419 TaxID=2259865 RepID=UPI001BA48CB5|nr:SRPBCC family protein [Nocardiopsis sp. MG754419]MBR8740552.1 dimethyladenosine transferase [Nocardiopsis sp. MG754419]